MISLLPRRLGLSFISVTCALLVGCAPVSLSDLEQFKQGVQQRAQPGISPAPELPELARMGYLGQSARNPFQPTPVQAQAIQSGAGSCPQPNLNRAKGALEAVALDQLTFTGTLRTGAGGLTALVVSNEGRLYRVTQGQYLGLNMGEVLTISPQAIAIREWIATGDGCWQRRDVSLTLLNSQRN